MTGPHELARPPETVRSPADPAASPAPAPGIAAAGEAGAATVTGPATVAGAATVAAAASAPQGDTVAAAATPPPGPPPSDHSDGTPATGTTPRWRTRRHRRLHRLHIGRHAAPAHALDELQLTSESFGLLLGRTQAGEPLALRLFRPRPTRVVLIGGAWPAKLVVFRALCFGARAVVHTDHPAGWLSLGQRATGRTDRVAVLAPGSPVSMTASADSPILRFADSDQMPEQELPAWTTRMLVLPAGSPDLVTRLRDADILLLERLSPGGAAALAPVLGLSPRTRDTLQVLHDDMLAVLTRVTGHGSAVQYAWLRPSRTELETLGDPRRY